MADIELAIKIPDKVYGIIKYFKDVLDSEYREDDDVKTILIKSILKGVPFPKGHERMADIDAAIECIKEVKGEDAIWAISLIEWACGKRTIIEADTHSD